MYKYLKEFENTNLQLFPTTSYLEVYLLILWLLNFPCETLPFQIQLKKINICNFKQKPFTFSFSPYIPMINYFLLCFKLKFFSIK